MKKRILTVIVVFLMPIIIFGQKPEMKFGKISKEELEMEYYEQDSSANALVLFDKGYSYFVYDNNYHGFKLIFERHVRIKFFNKEGFSSGDFRVPLYVSNNGTKETM